MYTIVNYSPFIGSINICSINIYCILYEPGNADVGYVLVGDGQAKNFNVIGSKLEKPWGR